MLLQTAKTVYLDASAALRWILRAPGTIAGFGKWRRAGSSVVFEMECCRALDRIFSEGLLTPEQYAGALAQVQELWESMEQIPLGPLVIALAKQRFAMPIKTLDAIHAASARLWSEALDEPVLLLSHDSRLNLVARTLGLKTLEET
ncbi:MAG: type II toxin-antitoxin system VapC family toxin [Turneriella sp.]|nr:type II toxin-antitoxin system VapC family toxin [Turneriella sp.]